MDEPEQSKRRIEDIDIVDIHKHETSIKLVILMIFKAILVWIKLKINEHTLISVNFTNPKLSYTD